MLFLCLLYTKCIGRISGLEDKIEELKYSLKDKSKLIKNVQMEHLRSMEHQRPKNKSVNHGLEDGGEC